jgi:FkbM family methyltransferase
MPHYSQYGQDALIGDVLFKGRSGVFVDVGARDGKIISNTFYLEQERGWTGIAIEPHPDLFQTLKKIRSCTCVNYAVSDRVRESMEFVKFMEEPFGNSGLLATFRNPERLQRIKHEIIAVPCRPLSQIVAGIPVIHYLDIDVEGHELAALQGIDFSAVEIRVIGVEVGKHLPDSEAIDGLLAARGFRPFIQLQSDRFYACGPGLPSARRLAELP